MYRNEFMELVYETFADEPDNVLANGIIEAADAYVEYEKAQHSQEGTTFDTISRQQAIDEIKNYCKNGCDIAEDNWCPSCQREQFIELLKVLPSAQPELTDEQVIEYCKKKGYKIVSDDLCALIHPEP